MRAMKFLAVAAVLAALALTVACSFSSARQEPERQSRIKLVSPNGQNSILIEATDEGPAIWLSNGKTKNTISIFARYSEGCVIGMYHNPYKSPDGCNLALALEKVTGSPFIQLIDPQGKLEETRKPKFRQLGVDDFK